MNQVFRKFLAIILGFATGLLIGPISVFAIHTRFMLRDGEAWPEWTPEYFAALVASALPAAINGAIGAGLAVIRGIRERMPVTIMPIALHVVVALWALASEPQSFLGFQWYTLIFTTLIWTAGRVGQCIGYALGDINETTKQEMVRESREPDQE